MAEQQNSNIRTDLIPYRAGILRVTPLDSEMRPMYNLTYTTDRNFLLSTQVTETSTQETLENGNGEDLNRTTGTTRTLAISVNVFDPKLHSTITGTKLTDSASNKPISYDSAVELIKEGSDISEVATYTFPNDQYKPVKVDGTTAYIEIKDTHGNLLTQRTDSASTLKENEFFYDPDTRKLTANKKFVNATLPVVYYIDATDGDEYQSSAASGTKVFMIETMGEMQSAGSDDVVLCSQKITRASLTGDIPNAQKQKSITSTLTYNFSSIPVPKGISPFIQTFKKQEAAKVVE